MNEKEMYETAEKGTLNEKTQIAQMSNLPEKLIYKMAEDRFSSVRWEIAEHPNLPDDLVYKLGKDEAYQVRWGIAGRSDLPVDLIIRLCCDEEFYVKNTAFEKLEPLKSLTKEDLENAYDLIYNSKYVDRKEVKNIFNYLSEKFPKLSDIINALKKILLIKV